MDNPRDNKELMRAIDYYLTAEGLVLPENAEIRAGIDFFKVCMGGVPVLAIGDRPPTVIYEVHKTEHTDKYLRPRMAVAV